MALYLEQLVSCSKAQEMLLVEVCCLEILTFGRDSQPQQVQL